MEPDLVRILDAQRAGRGLTRSEAVAQAVEEWVRARMSEDRERVQGVAAKIDRQADRLAAMVQEARIASEMMLTLYRQVSPAAREVPREELRRRAVASIRVGRKERA